MRAELVALFADPRQAEQAVRAVEALGVEGIRLASPAPYRVLARAARPGTERLLGWLVLAGALAGLLTGIALQVTTSLAHPMIVGGKAILAWPSFAVICFELTMFGAGATNFVAMAVLGGLARRGVPRDAKQAVASNRLAVVVPLQGRTPEAILAIRQALAGAEELRS